MSALGQPAFTLQNLFTDESRRWFKAKSRGNHHGLFLYKILQIELFRQKATGLEIP
jgi:hypothetical protein